MPMKLTGSPEMSPQAGANTPAPAGTPKIHIFPRQKIEYSQLADSQPFPLPKLQEQCIRPRGYRERIYCFPQRFYARMIFMQVHLKLIATYRQYLPPEAEGNSIVVTTVPGIGLGEFLSLFDIPLDSSSVILVNGLSKPLDEPLKPNDAVFVFPAMEGG